MHGANCARSACTERQTREGAFKQHNSNMLLTLEETCRHELRNLTLKNGEMGGVHKTYSGHIMVIFMSHSTILFKRV